MAGKRGIITECVQWLYYNYVLNCYYYEKYTDIQNYKVNIMINIHKIAIIILNRIIIT